MNSDVLSDAELEGVSAGGAKSPGTVINNNDKKTSRPGFFRRLFAAGNATGNAVGGAIACGPNGCPV